MAAIDDLNTAVAALQTEQAGLTTLIAQALAALAAGSTGAQDPAIEAAATAVANATTALAAAGAQLAAALPPPPAPPAPAPAPPVATITP